MIGIFDIVDLSITGVLESHPDITVDRDALDAMKSDFAIMDTMNEELDRYQSVRVAPDVENGTLTLTFENNRTSGGLRYVSAVYGGVFQ